ncbi:MAG: hypothetical protein HOC09_35995, partial [Deltaproteobacteria bacterium]|nr:hypothetical protein [Deltaproteobacteria bacterium]
MFFKIRNQIQWYVGLVVVLMLMAWGLGIMTKRLDYIWYWNRVPQYFIFTGLIDEYASDP